MGLDMLMSIESSDGMSCEDMENVLRHLPELSILTVSVVQDIRNIRITPDIPELELLSDYPLPITLEYQVDSPSKEKLLKIYKAEKILEMRLTELYENQGIIEQDLTELLNLDTKKENEYWEYDNKIEALIKNALFFREAKWNGNPYMLLDPYGIKIHVHSEQEIPDYIHKMREELNGTSVEYEIRITHFAIP